MMRPELEAAVIGILRAGTFVRGAYRRWGEVAEVRTGMFWAHQQRRPTKSWSPERRVGGVRS